MTRPFGRFIAVDWSGAAGRAYRGIAVAQCPSGVSAPAIIPPPGRNWRRAEFVEWLTGGAFADDRLLIGIDCAFALPAPTGQALLGRPYAVSDLWDHIDRICAGQEDYYGGAYARHPSHSAHFWHSGPRPGGFAELHREAERACRAAWSRCA